MTTQMAERLPFWERSISRNSVHQLALFIVECYPIAIKKGRFIARLPGLWDADRQDNLERVISWLLRPTIGNKVEAAFFAHSQEPIAERLSLAVDYLGWMRARKNSG